MDTESVRLPGGEELVVRIMLPPLLGYAEHVTCWADVREEILSGQLSSWLFTPYFVGEMEGEVAGSMSYFTSVDAGDVGVVEFVTTEEKHRRKGVATILLERLVSHFRARGGQALYLCTTNPAAGALYEKLGFCYYVGDGMRCVTGDPEDFDATYLGNCGRAHVRDARWGDLARASLLFNHPAPGWLVKDYLTGCFRDTRFESHFVYWMKQTAEAKGVILALENPAGLLVGAAAAVRKNTYFEQHVADLSFRVCPAYMDQSLELLEAVAANAMELGIGILQVRVADGDEDEKLLLRKAGFREEARLRGQLRDGDEWQDLLVYCRQITLDPAPYSSQEEYYGSRKAWQAERVSQLPQA